MVDPIKDLKFDFSQTEKYILSIQVSLDGFSFSVVHPDENRLLVLENFPVTISSPNFLARRFTEWYESHELIQKKYAKTLILLLTDKFSLIPGEWYHYENQTEIFSLVFGKESSFPVKDNYIPAINGNLLFPVPDSFSKVIGKIFPGHSLLHPVTLLIQKLQNRAEKGSHTLSLLFGKKSFCLLLYSRGKLQAANSFDFFHTNDVIYYVLSLLKQQGISVKETELLLTGEILPDGELYSGLSNYFSNTSFLSPEINFDTNTFTEPLHRFFTLP
jgi:hypothetical protein